jgi:serine/threonine protein kinase
MAGEAGFPRPFGDYLLLSSFGRGGMGEVFLAKRTAFEGVDRLCVIKTLRGELADDQEYINRFLDEARVVVQLHHATICQVFDAGMVGGDYFMAMEYISGTNLRDLGRQLVDAGTALEPGIALYLLSETLDALAYAHRLTHAMTGEQLGIVHRDVSPHNVMLSFEGEVKLIDFGLAESTLKEEQTESAIVLGKVAYMSPEQARGEQVDASVDQFAAAVMGYELLSHERFYGTMKTHEIWQIVGHGHYAPRLLETLDPEVQQILKRGWDAHPGRRYPSCDAMREAIDDFRALRYPRVGKKQARTLMQGLYQERIHNERRLLQSYAELSSPNSLKGHHSASQARSTSLVAMHGVAEVVPRGPVEMTTSASASTGVPPSDAPPTLTASQPSSAASEPSASAGTLTRQEQAFIGAPRPAEDAPSSSSASVGAPVVSEDAPPSPAAAGRSSSPLVVGLVAAALMAAVVVVALGPEVTPVDDKVLTDPSPPAPLAEAPSPVPPTPASPDAGAVAPIDPPPPSALEEATDTPPPRARRRRRRRAPSRPEIPAPPVETPAPDPPEPQDPPPPVKDPADAAPKVKPKPLASLSTRELKRRLEACGDPCGVLRLENRSSPAKERSFRALMVNCLKTRCR